MNHEVTLKRVVRARDMNHVVIERGDLGEGT